MNTDTDLNQKTSIPQKDPHQINPLISVGRPANPAKKYVPPVSTVPPASSSSGKPAPSATPTVNISSAPVAVAPEKEVGFVVKAQDYLLYLEGLPSVKI